MLRALAYPEFAIVNPAFENSDQNLTFCIAIEKQELKIMPKHTM